MRMISLLGVVLLANFVTAGLGTPLPGAGKFSVSNIGPVVFVALAGLMFLASTQLKVNRKILWFLLLFNLAACASFCIYLLGRGWQPNFLVLLFQDIEILLCLLMIWYARDNLDELRSIARIGIYGSVLFSLYFGWRDFQDGNLLIAFGMDDKSQAAVMLACQAFVLIRFFGGPIDRLVGLGLLALSFATVSRLPVFLVPAVMLALVRRSQFGRFLALSAVAAVTVAAIIAVEVLGEVFYVVERLSSMDAIVGEASTSGHMLLIKTALQIKFTDPWAFFFGIGPGNFSKALLHYPDAIWQFERIDPNIVPAARMGMAPLHSSTLQLLLDYNIAVFVVSVFFLTRVFQWLLRARNLADLAFFGGILMAASFYSVHNKPYFYLLVTTVGLLVVGEVRGQVRASERVAEIGEGSLAGLR